ncbi:MAG: endoribonuclease YicC domain-containing protein [Flavonifractor plautii]
MAVDEETVRLRVTCPNWTTCWPRDRRPQAGLSDPGVQPGAAPSAQICETAGYVVDIKAEIEKIREQIQNIE